jgi:hypothetical protein
MDQLEYEVLDELYFVTSFSNLLKKSELEEHALQECLKSLFVKGWIKCFRSVSEELDVDEVHLESDYAQYYYLASKSGLLAHHRI